MEGNLPLSNDALKIFANGSAILPAADTSTALLISSIPHDLNRSSLRSCSNTSDSEMWSKVNEHLTDVRTGGWLV